MEICLYLITLKCGNVPPLSLSINTGSVDVWTLPKRKSHWVVNAFGVTLLSNPYVHQKSVLCVSQKKTNSDILVSKNR